MSSSSLKEELKSFGLYFLPSEVEEEVSDIIGDENDAAKKSVLRDFCRAVKNYDKFQTFKFKYLEVRLSALLYGPPGTGKTTLVKAMAKENNIPVFIVFSDSLVSPLLGETLQKIRSVLERATDIAKREGPLILFFDEIDAIGSERSNIHEVGEIKRAVVTFLQHIDNVLSQRIPLGIVGATNHEHMLDSAIWRRFVYHIKFELPSPVSRQKIIQKFIQEFEKSGIPVHVDIDELVQITNGYSGADIKRAFSVALLKGLSEKILEKEVLVQIVREAGGTKDHIEHERILSGRARTEKNSINDYTERERDIDAEYSSIRQ